VESGGGGSIESLSAVTLTTPDMAAAVSFFDALGFSMLYGGTDAAFTSYAIGESYLNLQQGAWTPSTGVVWGRVVIWVDDVDAMHVRAIAAGYRPLTDPVDAPWGERYFHITDPNGHELSFARRVSAAHDTGVGRRTGIVQDSGSGDLGRDDEPRLV
jgi:catechol 2,3-dioxygenase-like lactoylglutathione lyase family enzyme